MNNFGERLFKLRREKKLARDALGAKIGVSKTAIKNWEDGENVPKLEYLQALAEFFKVDFNWLAGGENDFFIENHSPSKSIDDKFIGSPSTIDLIANLKEMEANKELTPQLVSVINGLLETVKSASAGNKDTAHKTPSEKIDVNRLMDEANKQDE